jgi:hypothetical protein
VRRFLSSVVVLGFILLVAAAVSPGVLAAGHEKKAAEHPIVGAWVIEAEVACEADQPCPPSSVKNLAVFHPEGTAVIVYGDGTAVGAWQSTGKRTADATFRFHDRGEDGDIVGSGLLDSSAKVAKDGQSFSATGNVAFLGLFDTEGEFGPLPPLTATRITVEPMGEPVGPADADAIARSPWPPLDEAME